MNTTLKFPFYAKFAFIVIGLTAVVCTMYFGQHIIVPLIYATIIAILLNPLVNLLVRKNINRVVAISFVVFLAILVVLSIVYLISAQITLFNDSYPLLKERFNEIWLRSMHWISVHFNIKPASINKWIKNSQEEAVNNLGGAIGQTIFMINSVLVIVVLLPVYLFMILFYKNLLLEFVRQLFNAEHHEAVFDVLTNSKKIIQVYLIGLLFEAAIIATLNSLGLFLLGIEYAIILGITGALLNVIPYIGGVVAIALPMIIAFVTKDSYSYSILVLIIYVIIQFVDNHFIIPHIVAAKVKLNALVSVIVVLIGGALWGIPGMFLSIPLTAIVKVIFDNVGPFKPWGFLLGNVVPTSKMKLSYIKKRVIKS
ncbi:MAG: AI-2E family transporter [Saprospiraceae bacterium]